MATLQTEALEVDYSTTDAPAGATEHNDTSLVSTETGAFECKQYVGPVDTAGVMHSGIIMESAGKKFLESVGGSGKEVPGDREAACSSDSIALGDNDDHDARGGVIALDNTVPVFDKREAFEIDRCALDSDNVAEMQAAASEHDGAMMASARAEGFDNAKNADDSLGSPIEQGIVRSSPEVHKSEKEATISFFKDNKGHITAPMSSTSVIQEMTLTAIMASSQEESFEVPATDNLEGGKFMDATFHDVEENQVAVHAYDIDFDIDERDMPLGESFFDENCIFPALDADKTDLWHAGVDNVIMEESSARAYTNQHPEDVDMKSLTEETNVKHVTMHEARENVAGNAEWLHGTQHQPGCETVLVDDPHEMDEASDLSVRQVKGHEELAGYPRNETGAEILASGVAQDKELACNYSKVEDAQEIQVQYGTDDLSASLANENTGTVRDAGTCEAKRPITEKEIEFEPTSINMPQEDAAVDLPKLNDCMPGDLPVADSVTANLNPVSRDVELHMKTEDSSEGSRLDSCIGQEGVNVDEQLVVNDSSGALGAASPALRSDTTELEHVPFSCEEGESTSVIVCREVFIEAVSVPLAQEGASMLEQNAVHDILAVNDCESQNVMSQVEARTPLIEPVQNQSDEPVVEDGKPVNAADDGVLLVRNSEVKEICESRDEIVEVGKGSEQEGRAWNEENEQSDTEFVDVYDGSLPEQIKSELKESDVSKDEVEEGKGAQHGKSQLNEEPKQSGGGSVSVFDGSLAEMRKSDLDEISDSRDGITGGKIAVLKQEIIAPEGQSLIPMVDTVFPQAESTEVSNKQEFSAEASILPSLSASETNVSSGTNNVEKMRVADGPKDGEKSAPVEEQSAASLEESSESRRVSAIAPSKKQSKKVISDDKLPKAELSNKFNLVTANETKEGDHVGDYAYANCQSALGEESSVKKVQKRVKQGFAFGIGDLVWAKVRSHPWWPAQIFDPADASKSARKAKKSGRVLAAFFGDCTFAWLQQSQMIAFRPNFEEKAQQTTMRIFCLAVEEALEELCRRSELGLSCRHFEGSLHSTSSFPDANTGIREGVRFERFKYIRTSAEMFKPKKTLEFVRNVAAAPLGAWSSTLQWAESRGHAYGLRTCMVAMQGLHLAPVLPTPPAEPLQGVKLKRSHSSLDAEDIGDAGHSGKGSKRKKKLKSDKDRKVPQSEKDVKDSEGKGLPTKAVVGEEKILSGNTDPANSGMKDLTDIKEGNTDRNIIKIKLSRKKIRDNLLTSEKRLDSLSVDEAGNLDDGKETLLAIAGHSEKALKRSSLKEEKISRTSKKVRRQIGEASQNDTNKYGAVKASLADDFSDMDADAPLVTEDTFNVLPSPSKHRVKKTEWSKTSVEIGSKKESSVKDNSSGKTESVTKFSKVGDSIKRVASELKGTPVVNVVDDVRFTGSEVKEDLDGSPRERHASPMSDKVSSKELSEDVSLLQLRRDLELLSKKAGSGGAKGKTVKVSKKGDQVEAIAEKSSPQWQSVPQRSQRSCVQELALAARKRKSELVHDDILSKLPKNSSTSGFQRHHASKGYITSAEKVGERKSYDKSLLLYSRRPAPPASSMKGSSQRYDEKLSSHAPLGLFMKFPEDFPLPSEAQLKAIFIPFGPLQMSATRLYKDPASAQVVFKHGRDAESALKHAKKNPMFGQVAVTYRLRHLSHSMKIEMKTDSPSSNKAYLSQVASLRESASSKDKLGSPSASLAKRTGDKEVISSTMLTSSNPDSQSGSEPTGDIQDQMIKLLRQVSVIVNTSPVTSDGP